MTRIDAHPIRQILLIQPSNKSRTKGLDHVMQASDNQTQKTSNETSKKDLSSSNSSNSKHDAWNWVKTCKIGVDSEYVNCPPPLELVTTYFKTNAPEEDSKNNFHFINEKFLTSSSPSVQPFPPFGRFLCQSSIQFIYAMPMHVLIILGVPRVSPHSVLQHR